MVAPNRQRLVRNHLIIVTLVAGRSEVFVAVQPPQGKNGGLHPPRHVSIEPFLKAGLSDTDALEKVLEIVALGVEGYERGNG